MTYLSEPVVATHDDYPTPPRVWWDPTSNTVCVQPRWRAWDMSVQTVDQPPTDSQRPGYLTELIPLSSYHALLTRAIFAGLKYAERELGDQAYEANAKARLAACVSRAVIREMDGDAIVALQTARASRQGGEQS